eukprot:3752083-Amphidinium_carterae.1
MRWNAATLKVVLEELSPPCRSGMAIATVTNVDLLEGSVNELDVVGQIFEVPMSPTRRLTPRRGQPGIVAILNQTSSTGRRRPTSKFRRGSVWCLIVWMAGAAARCPQTRKWLKWHLFCEINAGLRVLSKD